MLDERKQVLTVPEYAVTFENDSAFVQLLTDTTQQTYNRHPITTGLSDGIQIEVTDGLTANDHIRGNEATTEQ